MNLLPVLFYSAGPSVHRNWRTTRSVVRVFDETPLPKSSGRDRPVPETTHVFPPPLVTRQFSNARSVESRDRIVSAADTHYSVAVNRLETG
jgi:hypothetical protein